MLCPGEKQKSAAAFAFWIQQIAEKQNPSFVETCTFRFLVAYADPNVALPDFCTTPVSDFKALAHLLPLDELLRTREPQKWVLRRIWGLGGYT